MTNEEILKTIKERGLLLEKEIYDLITGFDDASVAKDFLESLEKCAGKIITKSVLNRNFEYMQSAVKKFQGVENVESIFVKLGLSLEIRKESSLKSDGKITENIGNIGYRIFYSATKADKKLEVNDFTWNFRARYQELQRILMNKPELHNLASIGKIGNDRQNICIIGIVSEKRVTKNKNLIIKFEDLTGEINTLVRSDKKELFSKASELQLDDVVGVKASGNRDMLFVNDILFPDVIIHEKTKFNEEICVAFLSDVHCGSIMHTKKSMENFLEWINKEGEKIKYIFFTGDNVDGVGIYPGQESG